MDTVKYQARIEIALEQLLKSGGFSAYTDSFEDMYGCRGWRRAKATASAWG